MVAVRRCEPRYSQAIILMMAAVCWDCGYVGNALALSTYPQAAVRRRCDRSAAAHPRGHNGATATCRIGRHGADLNRQVRVRRRAPHGAEHACRGSIPPVADVVHARTKLIRWKGRHGCSCVFAATLRCSSAAAVIAARSTAPAAARRKPGIRPSALRADVTRRAAAVA